MGLNEELEKIWQAEEWLTTEPPGSAYYNAARDHLVSVVEWSENEAISDAALAAIQRWADRIGGHASLRVPVPRMRHGPGIPGAPVPGGGAAAMRVRPAHAQGDYCTRHRLQGRWLGGQGRKA